MDLPATPSQDGRLERSRRTRGRVIDALLALYEEGDLSPTASRVAARAGVALRTVYGHFADMESLYAEAGQRELDRTLARTADIPAHLPYAERLAAFVQDRARVLEWLLPVMRASAARELGSPQLQRIRLQFLELGDAQVSRVFAAELEPLSPEQRRRVLDLVHLVAGGPSWTTLRVDRDLDPAAAAELVTHGLAGVLAHLT